MKNKNRNQKNLNTAKNERRVWIISISVLLAVALISVSAVVGTNLYKNTGNYLRKNISIESADVKIDNTMLSYYYKNACYNYINSEDFNNAFNVDKDLSEQFTDDGQSWHEYFMEAAISRAKQAIVFYSEAKSLGMELDGQELDKINKTLDGIEPENIRQGVKRSDIEKVLKINALADKYYNSQKAKQKVNEKVLREFVNENTEKFETVSYRTFPFNYELKEKQYFGPPKEETEADAEKLANSKNEQEFYEFTKNYFLKINKDWTELDAEQELEYTKNSGLTRNQIEEKDLSQWLFDKSRKQFDTLVEHDSEYATITVHMVTEKAAIDNSRLPTVRHILLTEEVYETDKATKQKAEYVLDKFLKTDKSEKEFADLVEQYSEDTGSVENGGLYENIKKGQMVSEFEDWCFKSGRKSGDTGIVKTDYGYHIMYYVGDEVNWYDSAEMEYYSVWHQNLLETLNKKYPITLHPENYSQIHF